MNNFICYHKKVFSLMALPLVKCHSVRLLIDLTPKQTIILYIMRKCIVYQYNYNVSDKL